jgi:hypothetical protein
MSPPEEAERGLELLKMSILSYLALHSDGASNTEIAESLKLRSNFEGKQKDYLTYSVLGLLIAESRVRYEKIDGRKLYFAS